MEKIKKEINDSNSQLFSSLSKVYGEVNSKLNQSYILGKKEAYEEVFNLLSNNIQFNGTKYLTPQEFQNLIPEKQLKEKVCLNKDDNRHFENKRKFHKLQGYEYNMINSNPFYGNNNNCYAQINPNVFSNTNIFNNSNLFNNNNNDQDVTMNNCTNNRSNIFTNCNNIFNFTNDDLNNNPFMITKRKK